MVSVRVGGQWVRGGTRPGWCCCPTFPSELVCVKKLGKTGQTGEPGGGSECEISRTLDIYGSQSECAAGSHAGSYGVHGTFHNSIDLHSIISESDGLKRTSASCLSRHTCVNELVVSDQMKTFPI